MSMSMNGRLSTPLVVIEDPFLNVDPFAGFDEIDETKDSFMFKENSVDPFKNTLEPFSNDVFSKSVDDSQEVSLLDTIDCKSSPFDVNELKTIMKPLIVEENHVIIDNLLLDKQSIKDKDIIKESISDSNTQTNAESCNIETEFIMKSDSKRTISESRSIHNSESSYETDKLNDFIDSQLLSLVNTSQNEVLDVSKTAPPIPHNAPPDSDDDLSRSTNNVFEFIDTSPAKMSES